MIIREPVWEDIPQIQVIRNSVKENTLSDPGLVTDEDCKEYLFRRGKGWVCEINDQIVGFSIVDLQDKNVWALFVHPDFENRGAGRKLHDMMIDWYFGETSQNLWLGTAPGTRAEEFYRRSGWVETGVHGKGEIKFEMSEENWKKSKKH